MQLGQLIHPEIGGFWPRSRPQQFCSRRRSKATSRIAKERERRPGSKDAVYGWAFSLYSCSIISARLSLQGRGRMPNKFSTFEQSSTELAGRLTGVGYSAVEIGTTRFTANVSYCPAISKTASAKACQVVSPLPQ